MKPLTEKQEELLKFIKREIKDKGRPPTRREMMEFRGVTINAVDQQLKQLEYKGFVRKEGFRRARAIVIVEPRGIPLIQLEQLCWK
jgi:repressor LexA